MSETDERETAESGEVGGYAGGNTQQEHGAGIAGAAGDDDGRAIGVDEAAAGERGVSGGAREEAS